MAETVPPIEENLRIMLREVLPGIQVAIERKPSFVSRPLVGFVGAGLMFTVFVWISLALSFYGKVEPTQEVKFLFVAELVCSLCTSVAGTASLLYAIGTVPEFPSNLERLAARVQRQAIKELLNPEGGATTPERFSALVRQVDLLQKLVAIA